MLGDLNYLSVVVALVASFVFGWLWYGVIFSKTWMRLNGMNMKGKKPKKGVMAKAMILNILGTFIMVCVFGLLILATGMITVSGVLTLALWIWLGFFVSTTLLGSVLWDMKPWALFCFNAVYWLINLVIVGLILVSI